MSSCVGLSVGVKFDSILAASPRHSHIRGYLGYVGLAHHAKKSVYGLKSRPECAFPPF